MSDNEEPPRKLDKGKGRALINPYGVHDAESEGQALQNPTNTTGLNLSPLEQQELAARDEQSFMRVFFPDAVEPQPDRKIAQPKGKLAKLTAEAKGASVSRAKRPVSELALPGEDPMVPSAKVRKVSEEPEEEVVAGPSCPKTPPNQVLPEVPRTPPTLASRGAIQRPGELAVAGGSLPKTPRNQVLPVRARTPPRQNHVPSSHLGFSAMYDMITGGNTDQIRRGPGPRANQRVAASGPAGVTNSTPQSGSSNRVPPRMPSARVNAAPTAPPKTTASAPVASAPVVRSAPAGPTPAVSVPAPVASAASARAVTASADPAKASTSREQAASAIRDSAPVVRRATVTAPVASAPVAAVAPVVPALARATPATAAPAVVAAVPTVPVSTGSSAAPAVLAAAPAPASAYAGPGPVSSAPVAPVVVPAVSSVATAVAGPVVAPPTNTLAASLPTFAFAPRVVLPGVFLSFPPRVQSTQVTSTAPVPAQTQLQPSFPPVVAAVSGVDEAMPDAPPAPVQAVSVEISMPDAPPWVPDAVSVEVEMPDAPRFRRHLAPLGAYPLPSRPAQRALLAKLFARRRGKGEKQKRMTLDRSPPRNHRFAGTCAKVQYRISRAGILAVGRSL
ncbi:hypothetical protein ABW21_db0201366 [Orbilia brochopaga]|nr:hypothetical protein ABW21_db0201366 [Drechslerella brochopaga]